MKPEGADREVLKSQIKKRRFLKKKQPDDISVEKSETPTIETTKKVSQPVSNSDFRSRFEKKLPSYKKMVVSERKLESNKEDIPNRESALSHTSIKPVMLVESLRSIAESQEAQDAVEHFQAESQKFLGSLNTSLKRSLLMEFSESLHTKSKLFDLNSVKEVERLPDEKTKPESPFNCIALYDDLMLREASKTLYDSIKVSHRPKERMSFGNPLFSGNNDLQLNYNSIRSLKDEETFLDENDVCLKLLSLAKPKIHQESDPKVLQVQSEKAVQEQEEPIEVIHVIPEDEQIKNAHEKQILAMIADLHQQSDDSHETENRTGRLIEPSAQLEENDCDERMDQFPKEEDENEINEEKDRFLITESVPDNHISEIEEKPLEDQSKSIASEIHKSEEQYCTSKSKHENYEAIQHIRISAEEIDSPNLVNESLSNKDSDHSEPEDAPNDSENSEEAETQNQEVASFGVDRFFSLANPDTLLPAQLIDLATAGDKFFEAENILRNHQRHAMCDNDFSVDVLNCDQGMDTQNVVNRLTLAQNRHRNESPVNSTNSSTGEIFQYNRRVNNDFYLSDTNKMSLKEEEFFAMPKEMDNYANSQKRPNLPEDITQLTESAFNTEQPNPTKPPSPRDLSPTRFRQKSKIYTVIQTETSDYVDENDNNVVNDSLDHCKKSDANSLQDQLAKSHSLHENSELSEEPISEKDDLERQQNFELGLNIVIQKMLSSKAKIIQYHWRKYRNSQLMIVSPEAMFAKFLQLKKAAFKATKYKVESKIATQTHEYSMTGLQKDFHAYLKEITKSSTLARTQLTVLLDKNHDRMKKLRVIFRS